jgi:acyl-CoA thioester hydrolase
MAIEVAPEHIDINGHVNNVEYLRWMQDVAIAHSDSVGGRQAAHDQGCTWFAREHHIKYLLPVMPGENLVVRTWADSFKKTSSIRRYDFFRQRDEKRVVEASTTWVYVDYDSGRPQTIPEALKLLYFEEAN